MQNKKWKYCKKVWIDVKWVKGTRGVTGEKNFIYNKFSGFRRSIIVDMDYTIGICDDEELVAKKLEKLIIECLKELGKEAEIHIYLSGEELLGHIQELNAVFLDVCMETMDGYETGSFIREQNPECKIVMETGESEYFEKAFEIGACRYLRKPFEKKKLLEALQAIMKEISGMKTMELYKERNKYDIEQQMIGYIRAFNGYTEYYVGGEIFRREISLSKVQEELDQNLFFRVHKQYVVNMKSVERKSDARIYVDDKEIPISRRRRSDFEKAYLDYLFSG